MELNGGCWKRMQCVTLRFARERKQLKRQLLTGCNDLTKALPTELVELIWAEMYRVLLLKPL